MASSRFTATGEPAAAERGLEALQDGLVVARGARLPVRLRPGAELFYGIVEEGVLALRRAADAGLRLEDRRTLDLGELAGNGPRDVLPEAHDVALAAVRKVEPPGLTALVDAVTASGHRNAPNSFGFGR